MPGTLQMVNVDDFRGGINKRSAKFEILSTQCQDALNVLSSEDGNLSGRGGLQLRNSSAGQPAEPVNGMHRAYMSGGTKLLVSCGTSWYTLEGTTLVERATGKTAGQQLEALDYMGHCFVVNGKDPNQRTSNGTSFRNWGFPAPGAPTDGGDAGAGSLNQGLYRWRLTWWKSGASDPLTPESSPSPELAIQIEANNKARYIGLPGAPADTEVTHARLYRTTVDGSVWYLETTIALPLPPSYKSEKADEDLDTAFICPEDGENDPPPIFTRIALLQDRVFGIGEAAHTSRVRWSKVGYPESFSADNWIDIDPTPGDTLAGIAVLGRYVVLLKRKSAYLLLPVGDSPYWDRVQAPAGCCSGRSVATTEDTVAWLAPGGRVYGMRADGTVRFVGANIEPLLSQHAEQELAQAAAVFWDGKYFLSLQHGTGASAVYRTYVWDTRITYSGEMGGIEHPWWPWDLKASCFEVLAGLGDEMEIYFGSRTEGKVYEYDESFKGDAGVAVGTRWKSKPFDFRPEALLKDFSRLGIRTFLTDNILSVGLDFDEGRMKYKLSIIQVSHGAKWGTAIWGSARWGGETDAQERENRTSLPRGMIGRTVSLEIETSDAKSAWRMLSFSLLYRPKTVQSTYRVGRT